MVGVVERQITATGQGGDEAIQPLSAGIVEAADFGILAVDSHRTVSVWNRWLSRASGIAPERALGRRLEEIFPALRGSRLCAAVDAALDNGQSAELAHPQTLPLFHTSQERLHDRRISQTIRIKPCQDHCLIQIFDASSSSGPAQDHNQELRTRAMLSSIADAVVATDLDGRIDFINLVAESMTGWSAAEARGEPLDRVLRVVDESDGKRTELTPPSPLSTHELFQREGGQLALTHRDGFCFPIEKSVASIRDEKGRKQGMVLVFRDVSQSRKLAAQLSWQASHDMLTSLYNRREFDRQLERLIESADIEGSEHCLLYIDLDRFKVVNDTCGHVAGDELLRQITSVIKEEIRSNDILARLGGDEFGILFENCPVEAAHAIADKIRLKVQDFRFGWEENTFSVGASIGLVPINRESEGVDHILSLADSACYAAKDRGRNQVHVYRPDQRELALRHSEAHWVTRIRSALEEDRFRLFVQPIRPTAQAHEKAGHLEVLIRMVGEEGELIPPGAFIPAAERYDLMPAIDRWVVSAVTRTIRNHYPAFLAKGFQFFINLSGPSLTHSETLEHILDEIQRSNLPQGMVCFEVTETAAISNLTYAERFIRTLQQHGCEFALDDFGSGLSSFGYLKNLPVNYLKIDGSFVKDMVEDKIDHSMVEASNSIGHIMGLKTIAEFVENDEILACLQRIGVDFAQGYGIRSPFPLSELLE